MNKNIEHRTLNIELRPAVFLDRDGTINHERNYLHRIEDFEFIDGAPQALRRLQDTGYLLVVVTNQSGVARGYFTMEDVERLNAYMREQLKSYGVEIDGIYTCPHHPTAGIGEYLRDCDCRKGKPGMLLQAAHDLDIDLKRSFMIGDKLSDVESGVAAGCPSLLVRTGYGSELEAEEVGKYSGIFDDLSHAADFIVSSR